MIDPSAGTSFQKVASIQTIHEKNRICNLSWVSDVKTADRSMAQKTSIIPLGRLMVAEIGVCPFRGARVRIISAGRYLLPN
jgi:hypothetical protein